MGLKDIIEMLSFEIVAETFGAVFFVGLMVWFFFSGGSIELFEVWAESVCG